MPGAENPTIRMVTPRDAAALVQLAAIAFERQWSEAFIDWKYFRNPAGMVRGRCAELDGQPVAYYSNIPVRLKLGDQQVLAAQAVDAMVRPDVRRQGLFYRMAADGYQQMDRDGITLTYAFPTAATRAGFLNRLQYVPVEEVPRYVKVLDPGGLARMGGRHGLAAVAYCTLLSAVRHLPSPPPPFARSGGVEVREVTDFDERFDGLWNAVAEKIVAATIRDAAYLRWRYVENPLGRYRILVAARNEQLAGVVVLSTAGADRTAMLLELLVRASDSEAGHALLAAATRCAEQAECVQLQGWMLRQHTFYTELLESAGFRYWPSAPLGLWRYTTPFIVRLRPGVQWYPHPAERHNWFLSMGDHDYY